MTRELTALADSGQQTINKCTGLTCTQWRKWQGVVGSGSRTHQAVLPAGVLHAAAGIPLWSSPIEFLSDLTHFMNGLPDWPAAVQRKKPVPSCPGFWQSKFLNRGAGQPLFA